ncbi:MAG: 3'-5' exonuclease [Phenylobacterium sp.]
MNFIVLDVEATCWENEKRSIQEIIEIGAVSISADTLEENWNTSIIIKPVYEPKLSEFCTELTSINQEMVDNGVSYKDAIKRLNEKLEYDDVFCSWGKFDDNIMRKNCQLHNVKYPFGNGHSNIKNVVSSVLGTKIKSVSKMCNFLGVKFQGRLHRGIDDALNMCEILRTVQKKHPILIDEILSARSFK